MYVYNVQIQPETLYDKINKYIDKLKVLHVTKVLVRSSM